MAIDPEILKQLLGMIDPNAPAMKTATALTEPVKGVDPVIAHDVYHQMGATLAPEPPGRTAIGDKTEDPSDLLAPLTDKPKAAPVDSTPAPIQSPAHVPLPIHDYLNSAPDQDLIGDLQKGRDEANKRETMSGIMRGFDMASAAVGHRAANSGAYDALDKQAAKPETNALEDIKLNQLGLAARQSREKADPASRTNRMAQEAFRQATPGLAKLLGPSLDNMTQDMIEKLLPVDQKNQALKLQQDALSETQNKNAETKRHDLATEGKSGNLTPGQQQQDTHFQQNELSKLGTATSKLSELGQVLKEAETLAPGITSGKLQDESKYPLTVGAKIAGAVPLGLGTRVLEAAGQHNAVALHNVYLQMADLIARNRTGAQMNKSEEGLYQRLAGNQLLTDPKAAAESVRQFVSLMGNKLRDIQSPYATGPEPVMDKFTGLKYTDPVFKGLLDNSTGTTSGAVGTTPSGTPGKNPPRIQMPDGSVWARNPDGTASMLSPPTRK